jgi:hypothetical protein
MSQQGEKFPLRSVSLVFLNLINMNFQRSGIGVGKLKRRPLTEFRIIASRLQTSRLHTRNPICPRTLAIGLCRDSCSADSADKGYFGTSRITYSSHVLREGAELGMGFP